MKKRKKWLSIALLSCMVISILSFKVSAAESDNPYEETHVQINLDELNVAIENNEKIVYTADTTPRLFRSASSEVMEEKKLQSFIEKVPQFEQELFDAYQNGTPIQAVGYTDALIEKDENGNWMRVEKEEPLSLLEAILKPFVMSASAINDTTGPQQDRHHLTLYTTVGGAVWDRTYNQYRYDVVSTAYWDTDEVTNGECAQATGVDRLATSVPNDLQIRYEFSATEMYNGENDCNKHSFLTKMEDCSTEYDVEDVSGNMKLKQAEAHMTAIGGNKKSRRFNSLYVHTYQSQQVTFNYSFTGGQTPQTTIGWSSTNQGASWALASYVFYDK